MIAFVRTLAQVFLRHGPLEALVAANERWTYALLSEKANQIASEIHALPASDTRIGIVNRADAPTYAAMLACWLAGRAYVPLEPTWPTQRLEEILTQTGIRWVFDSHAENPLEALAALSFVKPRQAGNQPFQLVEPAAEAEAYVLFTSGSTGMPKGVPITYGNLDALVAALSLHYAVGDRWLQMASLAFDLSVLSFLPCWLTGGCLCVPSPKSVPRYLAILDLIEKEQLTVLPMVPSVLQLAQPFAGQLHFPLVRTVIFGGEPLHAHLLSAWQSGFPNADLYNYYGPTEGTIVSTVYPISEIAPTLAADGVVAIGEPISGVQTLLLGQNGEDNNTGELCIAGPQVFSGYLHAPAPWHFAEGERWYRTGDLVERLPDGNLLFIGRLDRQVQIEGHRAEPGELEAMAEQVFVARCAAVPVNNAQFAVARLVLFVEAAEVPGDLAAALHTRLPAHLHPLAIFALPAFPMLENRANPKLPDYSMLKEMALKLMTT